MAMRYGSRTWGAMPQPIATPRKVPSLGRRTAASDGPVCRGPTSGLTTDPPCTSWSYCRMIQCLLAMFGWERRAYSDAATERRSDEGEETDSATDDLLP